MPAKTNNPLLPLCVDQLSYQADNQTLLNHLNFSLQSTGITVIMGPNGAGKSLLVRLLHGLLSPSQGTIRWNQRQFSQKAEAQWLRQRQSLVFQKPVLLRRSVRANIEFVMRQADPAALEQSIKEADLAAFAEQPARRLSGGEQQRLAVARALITAPKVIFFDETTANLDPANLLAIEQRIQSIDRSGIKVIMVTHDIAQAKRLADDVLFLHRGELVAHQSSTEFFAEPTALPHSQDRRISSYLNGEILL